MISIDDVKNRLNSLGYEVDENDTFALNFVIKKVEQNIKHFCNIDEVPDCLKYTAIDMVCGEFLQGKKATGQLTTGQMEGIIKRITDGDTTVEYSTSADASVVFDTFVNKLTNSCNHDELIRHRRLVW